MKRHLCTATIFGICLIGSAGANTIDNSMLPEAIRVPAGQVQSLWTLGKGEITYACKMKADQSGHAWTFVAPVADLLDVGQKSVGKYYLARLGRQQMVPE